MKPHKKANIVLTARQVLDISLCSQCFAQSLLPQQDENAEARSRARTKPRSTPPPNTHTSVPCTPPGNWRGCWEEVQRGEPSLSRTVGCCARGKVCSTSPLTSTSLEAPGLCTSHGKLMGFSSFPSRISLPRSLLSKACPPPRLQFFLGYILRVEPLLRPSPPSQNKDGS